MKMSLRACCKRTVRRDCFQRHQQLVFVATPAVGRENGLPAVGPADLDVLDADADLAVGLFGQVGVSPRPDPRDVRPRR